MRTMAAAVKAILVGRKVERRKLVQAPGRLPGTWTYEWRVVREDE